MDFVETGTRHDRRLWIACALGVATLALFARSVGHDFVSLDDPAYVLENAPVRHGLSASGVVWAFTTFHSFNWHPLTWLSHMLDVTLFGLRPAGHHLTNAVLHAVNAALLFLALLRMSGARWPSALAAALFALHPQRVESVAWVAERKDLLAGLFWMASLLAYAAYARKPGVGRYGAVLAAMTLGLLSKPTVVTLPVVLLLLDYWPLGRREPVRRLVVEKLPLLALSVGSAVVTVLAQASGGSVQDFDAVPLGARLANALVAYAAYLRQAVWPAGLAVFYPHLALLGRAGELLLPAVGAGLLMAAISVLAFVWRRRRPYLAVGWLWYLVTLGPMIGLVQVGGQAMADRYTYLPMVGIAIVVAWGARELALRQSLRPATCAAATGLVLSLLAALTWRQLGTWRDSETLYRQAVAVTKDNYFAHKNLGVFYRVRAAPGDAARAREQLEAAIAAKPDYLAADVELGILFASQGELERAAAMQERVLELRPDNARAHNALGLVRLRQKRLDEARSHFERAIELSPEFAEAHNNLGLVARGQGDRALAVKEFRRAMQLRPDAAPPRNNLRAMGEPIAP